MIKISVLIPVYNAEKFLEECLLSIINQSLKDIEIILINDGSSDNSFNILKKYERLDNRIKVFTQLNQGVSISRNNALKYAKGKYILWIDADDYVEEYLEEVYNIAEKENSDIIVMDYYLDKNKIFYIKDNVENNKTDYINSIILGKSSGYLWNKLIKTSVYKNNNIIFPENITCGEDRVVLPKLVYYSNKITKLNKAFYHYRYTPNSLSKKEYQDDYIFTKLLPDYIKQIEELEKFFYKDQFLIYNLKVINSLRYLIKSKCLASPRLILSNKNNEITRILLENIKKVNIDTFCFSYGSKFFLKGLKIFNYKFFLIVISFFYKLSKLKEKIWKKKFY